MKSETCSLYEDLNKLLNDICELLSEEVRNNGISLKNRNVANQLIERSKKQLQNISRIVSSAADNDSGSYMDMNKAPEYIDPDKKLHEENQEIYSDVEVFVEAENVPKEGQIICPYELTPAQEVPYVTKCGYLDRKEKFLFIEHQKRIFAAISKPWMMLYSGDKDHKPNETLDLRTYQVKTNENQRDSKKKDERCFELISLKKTKSYQFTASTPKDMLQWVAEIERVNPTYQNDFITPVVSEKPAEYIDDDDIYEKLRDDEHRHETNVSFNNKILKQPPLPNLPPRIAKNYNIIERPVPSIPPPVKEKTPEVNESKESSFGNSQSFSDDDTDDTYDVLITDFQPQTQPQKRSTIQNISNQEDEEEDVEYDVIQIDMTHTQQNNSKEQTISGSSIVKEVPCPIPINNKLENQDDDPELIYDLIQTDVQMPTKPSEENKEPKAEEVLKIDEKTEKVKPEISKVKPPIKPKVFQLAGKDLRANSKISSLVQQLTKKSNT